MSRPEAHHLDRGHDGEVDAAEDRGAEDRARDVALRVAVSSPSVEPPRSRRRRGSRTRCRGRACGARARADLEHFEREVWSRRSAVVCRSGARCTTARRQDQRDRHAFDDEQLEVRARGGHDREPAAPARARSRRSGTATSRRVVPDPDTSRNAEPKMPAADDVTTRVEDVGGEQREPGHRPGASAERRPDEGVDRAGVLVVLAQPHEAVRQSSTPIAASRNASGTARPTSPAPRPAG